RHRLPLSTRLTRRARRSRAPSSAILEHAVRHIRRLEAAALVVAEREFEGRYRIVELLELRRADDRRRDAGLAQQPCERDLRRLDAFLAGDCDDGVRDGEVGIGVIHLLRVLIRLRAYRLIAGATVPREEPA